MRPSSLLLAASLALFPAPPASPQAAPAPRFDVERLADGVYAVVRREPPSLYFEPNTLFIVGERDVVVVDAQFSLETTREVIGALRRITDRPVRYVVNTHGHDDHVTGNQVYRDTFPDVAFVGHRSVRDTMLAVGAAKRTAFLETLPRTIAYFQSLLETGKGPDGEPLTDEERAGFAGDADIASRFLDEAPGLRLVPPDLVVDDHLVIHQGDRPIVIQWLGLGHSAGDLVVHLPREGIVASGDLVVSPIPLVGSTSHPAAFAGTLARLAGLEPRVIVPGHGPLQRDTRHLEAVTELLGSLRDQVGTAVARGDSLPDVRKAVDLTSFRDRFAGASKLQRFVFQNYVALPAVAAAWADAVAAGAPAAREEPAR